MKIIPGQNRKKKYFNQNLKSKDKSEILLSYSKEEIKKNIRNKSQKIEFKPDIPIFYKDSLKFTDILKKQKVNTEPSNTKIYSKPFYNSEFEPEKEILPKEKIENSNYSQKLISR